MKPDFYTDFDLGQRSPHARLLFQGLWCHADCNGRLRYHPGELKVKILPYDDVDIHFLIQELTAPKDGQREGFIKLYTVGEREYIEIVHFTEHQKPDTREKPVWPDPPDDETGKNASEHVSCRSNGEKSLGTDLDLDPGMETETVGSSASASGFWWDEEGLRIWGNEESRALLKSQWLKLGMTPEEFTEAWNKLNRRIATGLEPKPIDPGLRLNKWLTNFLQNAEKHVDDG